MAQEQEAIRAALSGRVRGTDALEERATTIEPLEGLDPLDRSEVESSDDPLHGGGMPVTDPEESQTSLNHEALTSDLAMTGVAEDGAWMAIDEGGSAEEASGEPGLEELEDLDLLDEELGPLDDETAAEDLDALTDVFASTHDP